MKIRTAKKEARNALRKDVRPPEEFGSEDLNPRGQIAKGMEMSARRAISLHNALLSLLKVQGTVNDVKTRPMVGWKEADKHLKDALGTTYWRTPTWKYGWEWTVDHWLDGGLERSIQVSLSYMPSENRKRVKKMMVGTEGIDMPAYMERHKSIG